jgi:amino acid transporter
MKEVNIKKVAHLYRLIYLLLFIFVTVLGNSTVKVVSDIFLIRIFYYIIAFGVFSALVPFMFFKKRTIDSESIKDFNKMCLAFVSIILTINFLINILVQAYNFDHYVEVTDNLRRVSQGVENSFYYRNSDLIENSVIDRQIGGEIYDFNYAVITIFEICMSVLFINLIQNKLIIKLTKNQDKKENG